MNTNKHECRSTYSNEKRHQNAPATSLPWYGFVSFVDNPSMSIVTPPNQQLINQLIGVHSCPFVVRRFPWWMTLIGPSWPFVDHSFFFCFRQVGPLPCRADHTRVKQRIFMACREQGPSRAKPVFYLLNMDAQDRQDKQHERLRHRKQTRSMIGWVLKVIQEPGSGFWEIRVGTEAMVELMTVETLAK